MWWFTPLASGLRGIGSGPGQPEPYSETLSQKFSFAVTNRGWYCCYMQEKREKKKCPEFSVVAYKLSIWEAETQV